MVEWGFELGLSDPSPVLTTYTVLASFYAVTTQDFHSKIYSIWGQDSRNHMI